MIQSRAWLSPHKRQTPAWLIEVQPSAKVFRYVRGIVPGLLNSEKTSRQYVGDPMTCYQP